jgi:hypothetical protein
VRPGARAGVVAFLVILVAAICCPTNAVAESPDEETIAALIVDRAVAHGVEPSVLLAVAFCESRYRVTARGARGERGVFQWLGGRGNAWDQTLAAEQGIAPPADLYDRGDPDAAYFDVDAAAEMFSRGEAVRRWHWGSTYRRTCR